MFGMITMRAWKLQTCQLGMPCWSVGWRTTNAGIRMSFHEGPSSPRSNAFRFVSRTPGCWHLWGQMFPVPLEKSRWCRWVSCTQGKMSQSYKSSTCCCSHFLGSRSTNTSAPLQVPNKVKVGLWLHCVWFS